MVKVDGGIFGYVLTVIRRSMKEYICWNMLAWEYLHDVSYVLRQVSTRVPSRGNIHRKFLSMYICVYTIHFLHYRQSQNQILSLSKNLSLEQTWNISSTTMFCFIEKYISNLFHTVNQKQIVQ